MASKGKVSVRECDKISGSIVKSIEKLEVKIESRFNKFEKNHLYHLQKEVNDLSREISKIKISLAKIVGGATIVIGVINFLVQLWVGGLK